jgi:plasma-membrane proton-efflux P-type ATPase
MVTTNPSTDQRLARDTLAALHVHPETGLSTEEAADRLQHHGANDIPEKTSHGVRIFLKKFWGLSAWMLELIAVLSFVLGKHTDFWVALSLLIVNAILSFIQETRATAAVSALRRQLNVQTRVLRNSAWSLAPARTLVPGDIVRIRTGDFVPADLQIIDGNLKIDQSSLTGESREIEKGTDKMVYSGSITRMGEATAVVIATGLQTYFGRTAQLVETAQPKLHVEAVVARVVKWLFVIVGTLVTITLGVSTLQGLPLGDTLPIALVVLMSAIPVALPVMFTVSMALGSIELSRHGVLITRLSAVEDAASMDVLCADKTGTLTMNQLSFAGALPQTGFSEADVLRVAALASNEANADAIDLAFLRAARERKLMPEAVKVQAFSPFSAATRRTESRVEWEGHRTRCVKGALRTVADLAGLDAAALTQLEALAAEQAIHGVRSLAVAQAVENGPLKLIGLAQLHDAPRPDAKRLIDALRELGVQVKMLTGDALAIGREVARELGLDNIVRSSELRTCQDTTSAATLAMSAGGFAEVFPEDKFLIINSLQAAGHIVGMTGDGVNDAPALRQAEVGIAVSGATDVAKGAASAVLTAEGLVDIIDLVKIGRSIYQRVLIWIINKISRTILKAGLVVIAFLATGQFVISALGMVVLVFMTDFVKIALATDNVRPSRVPETWNIGPLIRVAVALGMTMLTEALGLLAFAWHRLQLGNGDGRLQTFSFLLLLFLALFSLISIRERKGFWTSKPSRTLAMAMGGDAIVGLLIGLFGFGAMPPLPLAHIALIIGWSGFFVLGPNDWLKTKWMKPAHP